LNKKLHETGSGWLQQVDYTYTIRGWLNKINDPSNIGNDYFAMEMYYNESLGALSQTAKHNGNITAIKWKESFGSDIEDATKAFAYSYFKNDQLQKASYGEGASFATNTNTYNEEGLTYDANGNIKTLQRKGKSDTGTVTTIDNLSYTYASNSLNRLAQVEDASSNELGFKNGATSSTEFEYDDSGNVKKDLNKGIDNIAYNELNKVKAVYFTGGKNLKYTYDATGVKLAMEEYDNTTLIKSTKYVGGFVYENDTLRYFASPEGRVVVNDGNYEYQYALSDHQGNTRTIFTSKEETMEFTATFETTGSGLREDTDLYENVDGNKEVSFPSANHTSGGSKVYKMNQTTPSGPGIMLRVYPGDTVEPSVYAYHENSSGYGTSSTSLAAMVTAVAGAFGGANGGGGESQAIYDTFNDALGVLGLGGNQGDDVPAAYLNYLFFDELNGFDTLYQHDDHGWEPVPSSAYYNKTLVQFDSAITIDKPGYIYVYLSYENESNNWVYFDDLKVEYTKSKVVQSNNYYAFGLQTKDSWTRMDTKPNQYLYNAGSELNEATSNYEMMFRSYDPAIGRMSGVDPMVNSFASLTPYNYSFNDPVYWNDPSGAIADNSSPNSNSRKEEDEDCSCGGDQDFQAFMDMYGRYNSAWGSISSPYSGGFEKYGVATGWSD
ncbi:MAG: RHS repeat-associated core domain-containing protein, partial [Cyclobacteriaceae bacterium]